MPNTPRPVVLCIGGSDSGAGAGIQADLHTLAALGVHGCSAITLVTAQNIQGVQRSVCLDAEIVAAQIQAVMQDFPVSVIKIGALGQASTVQLLTELLPSYRLPIILDPVLLSSRGQALLAPEAWPLLHQLLQYVALVTPNLPEATALWGSQTLASWPLSAAVLLKGGHGTSDLLTDQLYFPSPAQQPAYASFQAQRQQRPHTHGTGCTLASAIAGYWARAGGQTETLPHAVAQAQAYVQRALHYSDAYSLGFLAAGHKS